MAVNRPIFDYADPMNRFFAYARERHRIYLDKRDGKARPWTRDLVLQQYKFTNVFRELDAVTLWFNKHVRGPLRDKPEVLLATVLFRMFNRITTGEAIFCQTALSVKGFKGGSTAWDYYLEHRRVALLRQAIKAFVGPKGPYVTGAYIISTPPGSDKLDGVLRIVDEFQSKQCEKPRCGFQAWECAAKDMLEHPGRATMEGTWKWLSEFPYLGHFHSYEIVCDLRHTKLLHKAPDVLTWANVGPGARRGLNRIHQRARDNDGRDRWSLPISEKQAISEMVDILQRSRDAKNWPQGHKRTDEGASIGRDWPKWELREVEHTLCEFDKMERTRNGEGRPRSVYNGV